MTTVQIKKAVIKKISEIEDKSFLEAINTILDLKTETKVLHLSKEIRNEIIASREEIQQGQFVKNDVLEKELDEWLS